MLGNNTPLKLVVFDCDGTLVDSQSTIIECMTSAFNACELEAPDDDAVRSIIGLNLDQAIHQLMGNKDNGALLAQLLVGFRTASLRHSQDPEFHEPLFEGVRETLVSLDAAGILIGIATGKPLRGLRAALDLHDLSHFFVTLQTPDTNHGKPHPQMLEAAMAETGTEPANTFMVGDTSFDMLLARNAGCHAVGVSWGYHDDELLLQSGANHLIHSYSELIPTINL